ncbi:hypothetical protein CBF17_010230 [Pantoea agglomerans]|uniref:hypothetical protein n=1 Tax=Enterobacter agglomerans TaxID=549 RepID=UPI000B3489D9|nr:hypothetical protein [Pantoea agglomerans]PHP93830.1 hypothetical protein CBF17_010230 [Pantoea agglomerans]
MWEQYTASYPRILPRPVTYRAFRQYPTTTGIFTLKLFIIPDAAYAQNGENVKGTEVFSLIFPVTIDMDFKLSTKVVDKFCTSPVSGIRPDGANDPDEVCCPQREEAANRIITAHDSQSLLAPLPIQAPSACGKGFSHFQGRPVLLQAHHRLAVGLSVAGSLIQLYFVRNV